MYAVFACYQYYPGVNNIKFIGSQEDCDEYIQSMTKDYDIVDVEYIGHLMR